MGNSCHNLTSYHLNPSTLLMVGMPVSFL